MSWSKKNHGYPIIGDAARKVASIKANSEAHSIAITLHNISNLN